MHFGLDPTVHSHGSKYSHTVHISTFLFISTAGSISFIFKLKNKKIKNNENNLDCNWAYWIVHRKKERKKSNPKETQGLQVCCWQVQTGNYSLFT